MPLAWQSPLEPGLGGQRRRRSSRLSIETPERSSSAISSSSERGGVRDVAQPLELVVARAAVDHVDHRDAATRPHHSRHLPRDQGPGVGQAVN